LPDDRGLKTDATDPTVLATAAVGLTDGKGTSLLDRLFVGLSDAVTTAGMTLVKKAGTLLAPVMLGNTVPGAVSRGAPPLLREARRLES
jgi:hypothetical protein